MLAVALLPLFAATAAAQGGGTTIVAFRSDVPQTEHEFTYPPEQVVLAVKAVYEQISLPLLQSSNNQHELFTPT